MLVNRISNQWTTSRVSFTPAVAPHRGNAKWNRRIVLSPIIFFEIYLSASVLTFAFGPWEWPVSNPWTLYSFLILAQVALLAGYLNGIKKRPSPASSRFRVPMPTAVVVSLIANYLWVGQLYRYRTGQVFDLAAAVRAATSGLTDPGRGYDERVKNYLQRATEASTIQDYIGLALFPLLWIAFPLAVFFWHQLSVPIRIAFIVWTIMDLFTWVAAGTNKGIADFVILLPCLLLARKPAMLANIRWRNVLLIGLIVVIGMTALLAFFSAGMLGRSGGRLMLLYDAQSGVGVAPDYLVLSHLPLAVQGALASVAMYFGGGYYGLSLTLQEPFVFCYGVGNSYFLEGLSRHLVSTPLIQNTYPARIDTRRWNFYGKWHSIYPWIASDLTFPGTLVFMFLMGRLFAVVWLDVAFCRNPWAVCLLPLLLIMLFYIPANNQLLAFSPAAMPFFTLLVLWILSRPRSPIRRRIL